MSTFVSLQVLGTVSLKASGYHAIISGTAATTQILVNSIRANQRGGDGGKKSLYRPVSAYVTGSITLPHSWAKTTIAISLVLQTNVLLLWFAACCAEFEIKSALYHFSNCFQYFSVMVSPCHSVDNEKRQQKGSKLAFAVSSISLIEGNFGCQ